MVSHTGGYRVTKTTCLSRLFLGALLGLFVSACGGETRTKAQTCQTDTQCTGGKVCLSGTCQTPPSVPSGSCLTSSDCSTGEQCDEGDCIVNNGGSCTTAMDCPEDEYCQAGLCVDGGGDDPESCATNADCPTGKKCNDNGECVGCVTNADCTGGKICGPGQVCGSPTCDADSDCPGAKCIESQSKCVQCEVDADCAGRRVRSNAAKVCRNNTCTSPSCTTNADCGSSVCTGSPKTCQPCATNTECGTGKTCNNGQCSGGSPTCTLPTDCGGIACVGGKCENCDNDNDCVNGSTKGICDASTGKCGAVECTTADQCDSGEACYAPGRCGPCISDNECRSGQYCVITAPDTTGWCQGGGGTTSCTTNAQCAADLVCYQGQCTTCLADNECDSCEVCAWNNRCITDTAGSCTPSTGCTSNTQCPYGQSCIAGYCTTTGGGGGGSGQFGASCTNNSQCAFGLTCAGMQAGSSICTRPCVGSGQGGLDDCPSDYSCVDWDDTVLDGLKICYHKDQIGTGMMGYPYTTPPGGACDGNNPYQNTCQTSICTAFNDCASLCNSNGDCGTGEVCYAYPDQYAGYVHQCWPSDTENYLVAGEACSDNSQCDSGVCLGQCYDGNPCGSDYDCTDGYGCSGACVDHCRTVNDCAGDSACNFWPMYLTDTYQGWTPVCSGRIYSGYTGLGSACYSDAECDSEWCIDGMCTTPCATSDDCWSGTACTPLNFYSGSTPVYSGSFCLD